LRGKLDEAWEDRNNDQYPDRVANNLSMIQRETESLVATYPDVPLEVTPFADPESFDQGAYDGLKNYLADLNSLLRKQIRQWDYLINQTKTEMMDEMGVDAFSRFESTYVNVELSRMVLNRNSSTRILEKNQEFIRKFEPIYMVPTSRNGRAQLYAPVKRIGNAQMDTLWFNVLFIWFTTLLAYITLYLDVLRRILNFTESIKLRRESG
jgi:hypothetical protein